MTKSARQLKSAKTKTADAPLYGKLFMNGRSQAVRLPKEMRFSGDRVRVRKVEGGVLLEPAPSDTKAWLARLEKYTTEPFMPEGRSQPAMPKPRKLFD